MQGGDGNRFITNFTVNDHSGKRVKTDQTVFLTYIYCVI